MTSESLVVRDVQYTGDPVAENCAIVTRIAPTFLRFGSFEIFKKRDPQTGQEVRPGAWRAVGRVSLCARSYREGGGGDGERAKFGMAKCGTTKVYQINAAVF